MQVSTKIRKAGANFSNKDLPFSVLVREKSLDPFSFFASFRSFENSRNVELRRETLAELKIRINRRESQSLLNPLIRIFSHFRNYGKVKVKAG